MADQSTRAPTREMSKRVYSIALRATAATVVLLVFAGLVYLVSIDRLGSGALLLYAGVILGYVLNAAWRQS